MMIIGIIGKNAGRVQALNLATLPLHKSSLAVYHHTYEDGLAFSASIISVADAIVMFIKANPSISRNSETVPKGTDADGLVVTEWARYRVADLWRLAQSIRKRVNVRTRNPYNPHVELIHGLRYTRIRRATYTNSR